MNTPPPFATALRRILGHPDRGVTGLVDEVLAVCREYGLQLDWQADRCRVRPAGGEWEEVSDGPLRKSVFRAVLARIATLCNDRTPNSVSPYGGQGELPIGGEPPVVIRVAFVNTPAEQKLELMAETESAAEASQQHQRFE